jgi:hypothetical protein
VNGELAEAGRQFDLRLNATIKRLNNGYPTRMDIEELLEKCVNEHIDAVKRQDRKAERGWKLRIQFYDRRLASDWGED